MREEIPWWQLPIIGFEDEGEDEDTDDGDESEETEDDDDGESDGDESEDEDDESEDDDDEPKIPAKDVRGLKKALRQERLARKRLEKQVKALSKPKKDEETEDEDKDKGRDTADAAKAKRLGQRLRDQAVDNAILRYADKFKRPDEVLKLVDRSEIDVDQDEEDLDEIEVDMDSVEEAVKALGKKSPHLLKSKEELVKSGSKMNGRRKKAGSTPSDDALREKYGALRR